MAWEAVDARDPERTHLVEIHPDHVSVESDSQVRTYSFAAGEIGVGKWTGSSPGTLLELGAKGPFRIGAVNVHYSYETRAPNSKVDATLDAEAFHVLLQELQRAWRTRHAAGGSYRAARERASTRQYFALHRVSRWVSVVTALTPFVAGGCLLGLSLLKQLFFLIAPGVGFAVLVVARVAAEIELRWPSYSLAIEDGWLRIRRGKRIIVEGSLAETRFNFTLQPYCVGLTLPDGRRYQLDSRRRIAHFPFGVFEPLDVLFIDPAALPFLWSVVAPYTTTPPGVTERLRVPRT
jgi:hypothetical protein